MKSEVRGQLRVLDAIDRIAHKRKQEREHEHMLKAAKSRSKGADPEKAAKIREEAKQVRRIVKWNYIIRSLSIQYAKQVRPILRGGVTLV